MLDSKIEGKVQTVLAQTHKEGINLKITSAYRTVAHQKNLYKARQRGRHPYSVAKPGTSKHNAGLAVDVNWNQLTRKQKKSVKALFKKQGFKWAGINDPVHFAVDPKSVGYSSLKDAVDQNTKSFNKNFKSWMKPGSYYKSLKKVKLEPEKIEQRATADGQVMKQMKIKLVKPKRRR